MSKIIKLDSPITIKENDTNFIIDSIDKSKIEKGLFNIAENIKLISNGIKEKGLFITSIYYKEDTNDLIISSSIRNNSDEIITPEYIYVLTNEEIISIFREVIETDTKIFEINFIKEKIEQTKDALFKLVLNDKKIIIFKNKEIDILYGIIDDEYIFNRIGFEDIDSIILGEVLKYKETISNKEIKIKLYFENNLSFTITTYATINHQTVSNISYLSLEVDHKENQTYVLTKEKTNKKFNINEGIVLPQLFSTFKLDFLYEANSTEQVTSIYESNKNFFVSNIDICQYLLG